MTLAIGIVGAGKIAERHISAYKQLRCQDLYLADIDWTIARQRAAQWGVEQVDDPMALVQQPGIQAIDICTPTLFHAQYAVAALNAGKHVFCEKPLCLTSGEAREIEAAAIRANRTVMVGYLYRFHPAFEFVKAVLDQRIIGQPYMALIRLGGRGSASVWKHSTGQGAGATGEMMAHMVDLASWCFGEIEEIEPLWQTTLLPERQIGERTVAVTAEDFSVVRMQAGRVRILCESDLVTPSYMQHIDIQGDNGSIFSSILHYLPTILYCKEPRDIYDRGHTIYTFGQENLFVRELEYFLHVIQGRSQTLNGLEDSIRTVELLERLRLTVQGAEAAAVQRGGKLG